REEVLGEPVVDLARNACPLLRDGPPQLGRADRPPGADEDQREREQPEEVSGGDIRRAARRREDEVERCESLEREAEREPPGEVVPGLRQPAAPADDGEHVEERLHGERGGEPGRSVGDAGQRGQRREPAGAGAEEEPRGYECERSDDDRVAKRPVAEAAAAAEERRDSDETLGGDAAGEGGPSVRAI